jgi:hypothetical protein
VVAFCITLALPFPFVDGHIVEDPGSRADVVVANPRAAGDARVLADGRALLKTFGHGVAPYNVVYARKGDHMTGHFLRALWAAVARLGSDILADRPQEVVAAGAAVGIAPLVGAIFATAVARQLPLDPAHGRVAPDFFETMGAEFEDKFRRALSSIIAWEWFAMLPQKEKMHRIFAAL